MPKKQLKISQRKLFEFGRTHPGRSALTGLLVVVLLIGGVPRLVQAVSCSSTASCQQQINSLSNQNTQTQQSIDNLELQAQGYQGALNSLNAQISSLQQSIAANEAQQASLEQQITASEQEIASKKSTLADDVKTMYIDGQMTTIEELATSKNLSDFVDKQEYQTVVQNQLTSIIQQITALEEQLQSKKTQVSDLLKSENEQESQLSSAQAQESSLMSMNQQQQDAYNSQVSANKAEIAQLQKEQAAIIQAGTRTVSVGSYNAPGASSGTGGLCSEGADSDGNNGGYPMPWCNAAQDSIYTLPNDGGALNASAPIPYGDNRECTSYAYWYFTQIEGHTDFYDHGNANQWLEYTNYSQGTTPEVGAIAVETAGAYGHVAIVQALPGQSYGGSTVPSGYVLVSEMNYDYDGHFRYSYSPLTKFAGYIYP